MKPLIIYHANCTDGFGAAFCAWLKFGDEAEYVPMNYGFEAKDIPVFADREVYMVDFSWPKQLMNDLFSACKRLVWLDHHKTAFEMWCDNGEREFHTHDGDKAHIVLDNNKSGALLAWEYFHPEVEPPLFIKLIDDRDRWQFKLTGSKEFHAAMQLHKPWTFEKWKNGKWKNEFVGAQGYFYPIHEILDAGELLIKYQEQQVQSLVKYARKCVIDVHVEGDEVRSALEVFSINPDPVFSGLAVNTSVHMSEVGHELANRSGTFGLIWYLGENGQAKVSLRSNGDYDVSAIAKQFGGGGHRNAAGFSIDVQTLLGWLK